MENEEQSLIIRNDDKEEEDELQFEKEAPMASF